MKRDRKVEAVKADAVRRMELREREVVSEAREAVANAEGGKRMAEATAQVTIGELHQRNVELMRALEDYKVQQSSMTHDLDVARQYVSKVHDEKEARISENVLEQISSLTNEVVKWKSLAEHSRASAEGSPPAADPARSSLKVVREFTIHSAQSSNEDPSSNSATRVTRGRSPPAAAHRQVQTRKSTSRASGERDRSP